VSKRQFAHVSLFDGMGYQSPFEVDGGYRGRPYLDNNSLPNPVIALNVIDASVNVSEINTVINSIRVNFDPMQINGGLFNPTTTAGDLRPLTNTTDSGVALYQDNKSSGVAGEFDGADTLVPVNLESLSWNQDPNDPVVRAGGYYLVLQPQVGAAIPGTDFYEIPNNPNLSLNDFNRGPDYFVCVRTNGYAGARNAFRAFIRPGDINFVNGRNTIGSGVVTHPYTSNVPIFLSEETGVDRPVIPRSDSLPVFGINMLDRNNTFNGTPARWSLVNLLFNNNPGSDTAFTPSDLMPVSNVILRNIPIDPAEDNDNDPRTFALPDGIDNDDDGLTDEGVNNSLDFDLSRYTSLSGVAIFRDMPNSDRNGLFDDPLDPTVLHPDVPVFLTGEEEFSYPIGTQAYISIGLDHDPVDPAAPGKGDPVEPDPFEKIATNDIGVNRGNDYFVVVRTSKTISQGDDFQIRIATHGTNLQFGDDVNHLVVGTSFGFMPGWTSGIGPIFPNRQPFTYDPLILARLVPSVQKLVEEPLSPGKILIPGIGPYSSDTRLSPVRDSIDFGQETFELTSSEPFNLYEAYKHFTSSLLVNQEDGSDLPSLQFLHPTFEDTIPVDLDIDPGTVFLRWQDIDEDTDDATVTLVYFPVVIDPIFGEILPQTPTDPRFTFQVVKGTSNGIEPGGDIDDFPVETYSNRLIFDDNENVDPATSRGTDIFTWDARLVAPGLYRIAAFLDDHDNPRVVAIGGKILIENQRPVLILTEP
jgi:hypothetical protein